MRVTKLFGFWLMVMLLLCAGCTAAATQSPPLADGTYEAVFQKLDLETRMLTLDEIEFISIFDTERIAELGLDPENDFPSGFYLYNAVERWVEMPLADPVHIEITRWGEQMEAVWLTPAELKEYIERLSPPYSIIVRQGKIIEIIEMYIP